MSEAPTDPQQPQNPIGDSIDAALRQRGDTSGSLPSLMTSRHLDEVGEQSELFMRPSDFLAGYDIVRKIHEGGQGVVFQAIQKATKRKVAIKVMREGPFASRHDKARFEREVEILGQLNHPNIVAIHDSGTAAGSAYFVMDYISGEPLESWMAGGSRSVHEVLRLFARMCEAVNAAHLRGIIHRDLKPGNIRIGVNGEPHILDFGLAKVATGVEATVMTVTGEFIGSLPWASPEQAEGAPAKIDTRTDVYSLGVILYQMLTGRFPYDVVGSMREVQDRILKLEPIRPGIIRREIDDEVETIVLKCLDKERDRRYQTAGELARDVRHYLHGQAIEAKRDSTLYVMRKHLRQYRLPMAVAAGFVVMLAAGLLVSLALLQQARRAEALANIARDGERRQRQTADEQRSLAEERERIARMAYAASALEQGTALHLAGRGQESRTAFVRARDVLAGLDAPTPPGAFVLARDALARLDAPTLPAEVGLYRSFREFGAPINTISGHTDGLMAVAWLPDGIRACSASEDGTVKLWDVRTGKQIWTYHGHRGMVTSLAVSPEGKYVLSGGEDRTIRLCEAATGEEVRSFTEPAGQVRGVAFSADGRFALSAPADPGGAVRLWDVQSGLLIRSFEPPTKDAFYGVAFTPDGQRLLATTYEGSIWIWDVQTGQAVQALRGHDGYVISAVFSPDGSRVLSASYDHTLKLWEVRTGGLIRTFKGHTAGVRGVVFLGQSERALSCSMDGSLRLWNLETGEVLRSFAGHIDGVRGVAVSPNGLRAISAGIDRTVKVWDLGPAAEAPTAPETETITALGCSADGTTFVSGDAAGAVKLRDVATFRVLQTFSGPGLPIDTAVILPGGRQLFAADSAGAYRVWDVTDGREIRSYSGQGPGERRYLRGGGWSFTSVSPDGRFLLSTKPDRTLDLRNMESGIVIRTFAAGNHDITCVAISPDSRRALCGDEHATLYYLDLENGQCLFEVPVGTKPASVDCVAFSEDGRHALTGGHDLVIRLWDLASRRQIREFVGPTLVVKGVAFGRADHTVFAVGGDRTLRMWDAQTGRDLNLTAQSPMYCYALALVPPGLTTATQGDAVLASSGPSVSLWDVSRAMHHLDLARHLDAARPAIQANPQDSGSLATLGEWYAFRGVNDWAVEFLEAARAHGAAISPLTLARCYWQLGQNDDAAREFRAALARSEAPAHYLELCLSAVTAGRPSPPPTTAPVATGRTGTVIAAAR